MNLEAQLDALRTAGLRVIVAGEDDAGKWRVSIARSRMSPLDSWKTGSGPTLGDALAKALSLAVRKPRAKTPDDFEGLL